MRSNGGVKDRVRAYAFSELDSPTWLHPYALTELEDYSNGYTPEAERPILNHGNARLRVSVLTREVSNVSSKRPVLYRRHHPTTSIQRLQNGTRRKHIRDVFRTHENPARPYRAVWSKLPNRALHKHTSGGRHHSTRVDQPAIALKEPRQPCHFTFYSEARTDETASAYTD